ncbi:HAD family hydrolase [Pseudoxanthomonas sp. 10H]|uniref:HAD family hydrolase n=1 Tax=Pseudoxanthomonas sp. 10H TaxID=3242729 RepID=UPI003556F8C8
MVDALSSWNDGAAKAAITGFVARVAREGGPDYVPPAERIAVFDNDGTLWCEYPMQVQVFFVLDELRRMGTADPALLEKPAVKAMLAGDLQALAGMSKQEVFEPAFMVHAGMTVAQFKASVAAWIEGARNPKSGRGFAAGAYRPQRELLDYLRANGFKTFIVTGGGIEFVRVVSERLYGIPPEQVVGSSTKNRFEVTADGIEVLKLPQLGSFDDREEKVANIELHIGRRPILAFGNSDGDLAMLRYTLAGPGARLGLVLHHDDAAREFAYDRDFRLSPLREALDEGAGYGLTRVSMKDDWTTVFGD